MTTESVMGSFPIFSILIGMV